MRRAILVLLGATSILAGAFPSTVQHPNGRTFYIGLRSSPLAYFKSTEGHEVDANGSQHKELTRDSAIEFLSLSAGLVAAGIFVVAAGARRRAVERARPGPDPLA